VIKLRTELYTETTLLRLQCVSTIFFEQIDWEVNHVHSRSITGSDSDGMSLRGTRPQYIRLPYLGNPLGNPQYLTSTYLVWSVYKEMTAFRLNNASQMLDSHLGELTGNLPQCYDALTPLCIIIQV